MKTYLHRTRYLLILSAVTSIAISTLVFGTLPTRHETKEQQQETKHAPKLPLIISKVKKLEVISATIEEENGQTPPVLVLEIRNNSDLAVTAIALESGNETDSSGISTLGDDEDGNPLIVIKPRGTITIRFVLTNLIPGTALRIAGVTYADGTEDGDESTLKTIHGQRERDKAERDERKGVKTP